MAEQKELKQTKEKANTEGAPAADATAGAEIAPKLGKKKIKRAVPDGRAYIDASYNNTKITLTDDKGDVIVWSSAGSCNFKGPKKSTPYAASVAASKAVELSKAYGLQKVNVFVKGVGGGREQAIRSLQAGGLQVESIEDQTPIPHGGCRQRKPRRV